MKIFKRLLMFCLALAMLLSIAGCKEKTGAFHVNRKIVCEVDGEAITFDDYKYFFYNHYVSLYGDDFNELSEERFDKVKALTEDSLRRRAYIMKLVDEYDIELSDEDKETVNYYVKNQIEEQGGQAQYQAYLLENRMTGDVLRSQIELTFFYDVALRELLMTGIDKRVDMTDAAVIKDVNSGEFYRYAQIYFAVGAGQVDTAAREKINKAHEKLKEGYSFSEVANATWATDAGDRTRYKSEWKVDIDKGAYVAKGEKEAILENTVLALNEGEYSEPKWSGSGWHIFIRLPFDSEYVKDNIHTVTTGEKTLAEQSFARRYLEHIEDGAEDIKIEYARYFKETVTFQMLLKKEKLD